MHTSKTRIRGIPHVIKHGLGFGIPLTVASLPTTLPAAIIDLTGSLPAPLAFPGSTIFTLAGYSFTGYNVNPTFQFIQGYDTAFNFSQATSSNTLTLSIYSGATTNKFGATIATTLTAAFHHAPSGGTGWLRVSFQPGGDLTFLAAAYNPDGGIHVGSIPEPSTSALAGLAALAMGATGVQRLRRRKDSKRDS